MIRTRFAPSPTGDLHLGGAWTALAAWVLARRDGGECLLRVEDLDPPRSVVGSAERIAEDLAWLGLDFDGEVMLQSARSVAYARVVESLRARGLVYTCDCSRKEIHEVASAPQGKSAEIVYPGTCRRLRVDRTLRRPPAFRLRVPQGRTITIHDEVLGDLSQDVAVACGDFVLQRGDGVFAYQLAVAVDDSESGVTDIVRGADLFASTPRQRLLLELAEMRVPERTWHVPLVLDPDGERLAKRTRALTVRELRERGENPRAIVGVLAHALGLTGDDAPRAPREIVSAEGAAFPRESWRVPIGWVR